MADPIVLTSNLIPGLQPNRGALANIYSNRDPVRKDPIVESEDGTFTIPTYERTVVDDIPDDFDWSMYGRAGPTLRYFHRVRTGEIQYDPSNDVVDPSTLEDPSNPDLPDAAEALKEELIGVGTQLAAGVGGQIGRAYAKTDDLGQAFGAYFNPSEALDLIRSPDTGLTAKVPFSPDSVNAKIAKFDETINLKPTTQTDLALRNEAIAGKEELLATATPADTDIFSGMRDRFDTSSAAGRATLYGSAGAGLGAVAANLIAGRSLKDSVKTGAKVGAGTYVGTLIGGPIGGLIGGVFGGRVICNELMRQDVMTRKQVVLDYKFTRDHLTPTHVNGYHVWAVWMVKQMRKGRFVPFWKHVAGHRANEIAYIYGERDKPDYLGKVYRKVLEPICWSIGFFCKKTDWTVLYKQKEV